MACSSTVQSLSIVVFRSSSSNGDRLDHHFYIYSVSMPFWGDMVFHEEKKLTLPIKLANAKRQLLALSKLYGD